jgi:FkbM family methyltransferase
MKSLKLQDGKEISIEDAIYDQLYDQWYQFEECQNEGLCSYNFYDGGNFFDIGAFNGIYSYILSPKAKDDYFVSFEPDSRFTNVLQNCINNLRNNIPNINYRLNATPVGNGETVQFNLPNKGPNGEIGHPCFFGKNDETSQQNNNSVKSITIDDYVEQTNIVPKLIKIDVEGAELNILQGSKKTLSNYKPKIILELHEDYLLNNFNINPTEVLDFLKSFSYEENTLVRNEKVKHHNIKVLYFQ